MADQTLAKFVNERSILTLLRTHGDASRAGVARALGLTPATISRLTSDMLKRGLLREVAQMPEQTSGREPGRPGVALSVNPTGGYFLGVEIGVTRLRFVLLDLCTSVVESIEQPLKHHISPEEAAIAIAKVVTTFRKDQRYRGKIQWGGVTVPGLVRTDGYVVNLPILGWTQTNFQDHLSAVTDVPFSIENNANAAAFGAVYTQTGVQVNCSIFLKLGTGCGGAAIVNGRLLRGADGTGMELGHLNVGAQSVVCSCGQKGCLETWVNLAALARSYRKCEPAGDENLDTLPTEVADAFDLGDTAAKRALLQFTGHLATGLVSLVNIFNPSQIILSGTLRPVLERCLSSLRDEVAKRIIPGTRIPDIQVSHLGEFECAIGAACISHHKAFDISNVDIGATVDGHISAF